MKVLTKNCDEDHGRVAVFYDFYLNGLVDGIRSICPRA